jgi:hypothetical protein
VTIVVADSGQSDQNLTIKRKKRMESNAKDPGGKTTANHYEWLQILGEGAFGDVWICCAQLWFQLGFASYSHR